MGVTIHDVAKKAGVSIATVSRVINGVHAGSLDIRQRVLNAAEELGYVSRSSIRRGRLGDTMRFVMQPLIPLGSYYADILQGAEEEARAHNYDLYFSMAHHSMGVLEPHSETKGFTEGAIAGVIYAGDPPPELYERIQEASIPLIIVNAYLPGQQVDSVMCDNFRSAHRAVQYLLQLGHRRIACIGYGSRVVSTEERIYGYRLALQEAGIAFEQGMVRAKGTDVDGGYEAMNVLLALPEPPTAVFGVTDEIALGAMKYAKEVGLRVPENISFVGVNDLDMAQHAEPPLTTVHIPRREMGRIAVRRLLELIQYPDTPRTRTDVLCTFVERASCARAPQERT